SSRPPLPFGLGRDPVCPKHRCLSPDQPLPKPGSPLHDQVAAALAHLFQSFFNTSLRYLGCAEILDWLDSSGTVDAWILSGLEQGRRPDEIADEKNLDFGKEAFRQVVQNALEAEDEAWATSLRETAFSSSVSMVYEGVIAQVTSNKNGPVPCLHTLLTPTGLNLLKSAPLMSAFPVTPPRAPPSPAPLLASIRSLIQSGSLSGPAWKSTATWRAQIRKAFAAYHALLKDVAEELVTARSFAEEFHLFLDQIAQPIQLLQLIADDFESEFGPGATRGLLGVGEAGGDNLISVMDFCAARKPSELIARVKQRVAEKQERERRTKLLDKLKVELKELDVRIRGLLLEYRSASGTGSAAGDKSKPDLDGAVGEETERSSHSIRLQQELEAALDERDRVKAELEDLRVTEEADEVARKKRALAEKKGLTMVPPPPPRSGEEAGFKLGSSRDLLAGQFHGDAPLVDPFSTSAPRAVSPAAGSAKGKAKAITQAGKPRTAARFAPPPPQHCYNRPQPPTLDDVLRSGGPRAATNNRSPSLANRPMTTTSPSQKRPSSPPASAGSSRSPTRARKVASSTTNKSARSTKLAKKRAQANDEHCEICCPACRAAQQQKLAPEGRHSPATVAERPSQVSRDETDRMETSEADSSSAPLRDKTNLAADPSTCADPVAATKALSAKKKRKKKRVAASQALGAAVSGPADAGVETESLAAPPAAAILPTPLKQRFGPLSRIPPPKLCPPHICTGIAPRYDQWEELDALLYETLLAGFKYELVGALPSPLFLFRDKCAKSYLLGGGRMTTDDGQPKEMDSFLALAEERGLWHPVNHPEIQAWSQRVLALSMQKLVDVLRATLGDICLCKMSNHLDILRDARQRLSQCEEIDRAIPIDLPEMDLSNFMRFCHVQLRAKRLSGSEWEGVNRQYTVQDYLLAFSDAFDAAMDRLMLANPYILAEDMCTLLEWQGGIRAFETALRFGKDCSVFDFGTGVELLEGKEEGAVERRPLQAWGRLLELSSEARAAGTPFNRDLADREKQRGNDYFANGEFDKSILCFTTAAIICPTEPTYMSNSAAARMKVGTIAQYAEAVSDCTLALAYDPLHHKSLYRRGVSLAMLGRWQAAFDDLKLLHKVATDPQPAREALAWAQERHAAITKA
ncbi:Proteophosphoglycan ppg4, partial [Rhodotorula sp. JG-1b]